MTATIIAAFLPYATTLHYPFLHDDEWAVVNNAVVVEGLNFTRIVTTNAWGNEPEHMHIPNYRPFSVLTLAVTHALAGLDPVPYRITNILIHVVVAVLVSRLMARLGIRPLGVALAATWFALHPLHSETVLFVVNREEMLCAAFWLSALLLIVMRSGLVPSSRQRSWTPISLAGLGVLTALAVLSKEGGVTIPILASMVGLFWPGEAGRRRTVLPPTLVSGGVVLAYLVLRLLVLGHLGARVIPWQDNPLVLVEWPERLLGAFAVVFEAFRLLVAPVDMSVDYGFNALQIPGPATAIRAAGGIGITVLFLAAALLAVRHTRPVFALGVLVMAVAWAPVSHLAFPSSILLADRLLFLPSAGFSLVLGGLLSKPKISLSTNRLHSWSGVVLVVWILSFIPLVVDRAGDYRDAKSLFAASLRNRPGSTRLHNNLGLALYREGRWLEAEKHYRYALAIDPFNAEARNNLGLLLAGIGRPGSAAEEFRRALVIRPNMRAAWHNLCLLLSKVGQPHDAAKVCAQARAFGMIVEIPTNDLPTSPPPDSKP